MDKIAVRVLNPEAIYTAEKMMVAAARLTQKGHKIRSMQDFIDLYERPYKVSTVQNMTRLPHPTIQKFSVVNVAVIGASRRFLAQITRHQNEVKFMSASLQYSDYSDGSDFVVPYEILHNEIARARYIAECKASMDAYRDFVNEGLSNDTAGYMAPQGLRNALIISATPYQWKHMISQRTCRRNTDETRYVMLLIWSALARINSNMFMTETTAFPCARGEACPEGKMSCGCPVLPGLDPDDFLRLDFPEVSNGY